MENAALDTSDKGITKASPAPENTTDYATSIDDSSQPLLSVADPAEETAQEQQADVQGNTDSLEKQMLEKDDKNDNQSNKEFQIKVACKEGCVLPEENETAF